MPQPGRRGVGLIRCNASKPVAGIGGPSLDGRGDRAPTGAFRTKRRHAKSGAELSAPPRGVGIGKRECQPGKGSAPGGSRLQRRPVLLGRGSPSISGS